MTHRIIRYRVTPDRADENATLVAAVYEELATKRPPGLRYATFRDADGLGFTHIAQTDEGADPLAGIAAFHRFQDGIRERLTSGPEFTDVTVVGAYEAFDDRYAGPGDR